MSRWRGDFEILPEEVEIRMQAKEGFVVASEGALMAALITELTPELKNEGLAREFVRRVQEARKHAGFDIADRIQLFYCNTEFIGSDRGLIEITSCSRLWQLIWSPRRIPKLFQMPARNLMGKHLHYGWRKNNIIHLSFL